MSECDLNVIRNVLICIPERPSLHILLVYWHTHTLFKHTHSWCHVVSVWHWANTKYKHIGVNHGIGIHCVFSHLKLSAHWFNNQAADGDSRSMKHELVCDYYFLLLFLPANTQRAHGWIITKIQNMLSVMLPWNTVHLDCRFTWNVKTQNIIF